MHRRTFISKILYHNLWKTLFLNFFFVNIHQHAEFHSNQQTREANIATCHENLFVYNKSWEICFSIIFSVWQYKTSLFNRRQNTMRNLTRLGRGTWGKVKYFFLGNPCFRACWRQFSIYLIEFQILMISYKRNELRQLNVSQFS